MNRAQIEKMAGQMVVCSPEGAGTDTQLVRLIEGNQVGGVILFRRNCPDADRVRMLIDAMQRRAHIPLLVMIDQEGGRVRRLTESVFELPSARDLAQLPEARVDHEVGLLASRLSELGINCNLIPVLDVDSNPDNPVIGDRAFGRDGDTVWRYAKVILDAQARHGVIGCGKHFPGHGDTDKDSHLELPVVRHDIARLQAVEIEPFKKAVAADVPMLMSAHVLYPALDPDEPASLSRPILTDLLRGELGYEGVVVTDDLEMKAISGRYPTEELTRRLVEAGNDLLLVCHTYSLAQEIHRSLVRLVERGDISELRLKTSYDRILNLKRRFGLLEE
jgi:beta-N-acetylhexosaminidase